MALPRKVWAYWEGDPQLPAYEAMCVQSWRKWLPDWEITVVRGKAELLGLVDAAELPRYFDALDSVQKRSNCARLALLRRYGGVWHDMSILLQEGYDAWLAPIFARPAADFAGFAMYMYSKNGNTDQVVENWWFASVPGGTVVSAWHRVWNAAVDANEGSEDFTRLPVWAEIPATSLSDPDRNYLFMAMLLVWLRAKDAAVRTAFSRGWATAYKAEDGPFWPQLVIGGGVHRGNKVSAVPEAVLAAHEWKQGHSLRMVKLGGMHTALKSALMKGSSRGSAVEFIRQRAIVQGASTQPTGGTGAPPQGGMRKETRAAIVATAVVVALVVLCFVLDKKSRSPPRDEERRG